MIKFSHVSFGYGSRNTIQDLNFTVAPGEFVAVIGSNGAGKTTVSKLTAGILKPTSGSVTVAGNDTRKTRTSVLAAHVGFLFQNPDRQLCKNTVREEIAFSLELIGRKESSAERVEEELKRFSLPGDANPFSLSRGERQRVALASLLAASPEILVLDEPTTGLDYRECMQMMSVVRELNENGTTVLMVCHDMEVVLDFARRVLVMTDGRLVADGDPHTIFRTKDAMEQAHILPPQIPQLGARLGGSFEKADHIEEMADCIEEAIRNGRRT